MIVMAILMGQIIHVKYVSDLYQIMHLHAQLMELMLDLRLNIGLRPIRVVMMYVSLFVISTMNGKMVNVFLSMINVKIYIVQILVILEKIVR
jgi:hypothetical protein